MLKVLMAAAAVCTLTITSTIETASAKGPGGHGWKGTSPPGFSSRGATKRRWADEPPGFSHARESKGWIRHQCMIGGKLVPPGWCR
jgi:hypothetical protein